MIETHPFGYFIPKGARYLLLGSFPTRFNGEYVWFYTNSRNQFWSILEEVFARKLTSVDDKKKLLTDIKMGIGDIIYSCERLRNSHLDTNITNIVYDNRGIADLLYDERIEKIYFSSRFVEGAFRRYIAPTITSGSLPELTYLPSPSPRYAAMSREEKIKRYKLLLPKYNKK